MRIRVKLPVPKIVPLPSADVVNLSSTVSNVVLRIVATGCVVGLPAAPLSPASPFSPLSPVGPVEPLS